MADFVTGGRGYSVEVRWEEVTRVVTQRITEDSFAQLADLCDRGVIDSEEYEGLYDDLVRTLEEEGEGL